MRGTDHKPARRAAPSVPPAGARFAVLIQMAVSTALFAPILWYPVSLYARYAILIATLYLSNMATVVMIARLAALPDAVIVPKLLRYPKLWAFGAISPAITALLAFPVFRFFGSNAMDGLVAVVNFAESFMGGASAAIRNGLIVLLAAALFAALYQSAYMAMTRAVVGLIRLGANGSRGDTLASLRYGLRRPFAPFAAFLKNLLAFAALIALAVGAILTAAALRSAGAFSSGNPFAMDSARFLSFFRGGALGVALSAVNEWLGDPFVLTVPLLLGYTWGLGFGCWFWPRYRARHVARFARDMR